MSPIGWIRYAAGGKLEREGSISPSEEKSFKVGGARVVVGLSEDNTKGTILFDPQKTWVINNRKIGKDSIERVSPAKTELGDDDITVRPNGDALRPQDCRNHIVTHLKLRHTF